MSENTLAERLAAMRAKLAPVKIVEETFEEAPVAVEDLADRLAAMRAKFSQAQVLEVEPEPAVEVEAEKHVASDFVVSDSDIPEWAYWGESKRWTPGIAQATQISSRICPDKSEPGRWVEVISEYVIGVQIAKYTALHGCNPPPHGLLGEVFGTRFREATENEMPTRIVSDRRLVPLPANEQQFRYVNYENTIQQMDGTIVKKKRGRPTKTAVHLEPKAKPVRPEISLEDL